MRGRRWTTEEDAALRDLYPRVRGPAKVAAATGHTLNAVRQRAALLGVRAKRQSRPWTAREDRLLTIEWGDVGTRVLKSKFPGRTWVAIVCRAKTLGLGSPAQGHVSIDHAARVCGYSPTYMGKLIRALGVAVHPHPGGMLAGKRVCPRNLVDLDEVREAVVRHLSSDTRETLREAAARVGLTPPQVKERLRRAGLLPCIGRGLAARIEPADVDRAVAAWVKKPKGPRPGFARCSAERREERAA